MKALDKQKDKLLRKQMAEQLETEFQEIKQKLKNKIGSVKDQLEPSATGNGVDALQEIKPSPALVEELRTQGIGS